MCFFSHLIPKLIQIGNSKALQYIIYLFFFEFNMLLVFIERQQQNLASENVDFFFSFKYSKMDLNVFT